MSFWAQIPNRAMRPIVDETLSVSPTTIRATMPPMSAEGMFRMTSRACRIEPKDEKRMTKMIRMTKAINSVRCRRALCWLSNWPPKVT